MDLVWGGGDSTEGKNRLPVRRKACPLRICYIEIAEYEKKTEINGISMISK